MRHGCPLHIATRQVHALVGPPRREFKTMDRRPVPKQDLSRTQQLAERAFASLERFLHIEAVSGIVLLIAAALALVWANFPGSHSYYAFWHTPLAFGLGTFAFSQPLHFWINDALMTIFFRVVGLDILRQLL